MALIRTKLLLNTVKPTYTFMSLKKFNEINLSVFKMLDRFMYPNFYGLNDETKALR